MKPFYLYIKDGVGIHVDSVVFFNVFGETQLVLVFDLHKFLLSLGIIHVFFKARDPGQIGYPAVAAQLFGDPVSQKRIAVKEETPLGDAVGLVVELLRHHLIEMLQFLIL